MTEQQMETQSRKVFPETLAATTMICHPNHPVVTALGNGVMLQIKDDYYILSAGHLMNSEDFPEMMIPAKNDSMAYCNGMLVTTFKNYGYRNTIDIAVFKFSQRQNKHIVDRYRFIRPEDIILEHKTVETASYIISGYPLNNIAKKTGEPNYIADPLQLTTATVKKRTYKKNGFNPEMHILVKLYGRLKPFASSKKQKIRKPRGISGSGLWYIPNWYKLDANGIPEHFLVGILTDNFIDKGFVAAVRIDFATEIIGHNFGVAGTNSGLTNFAQQIKQVFISEIP